MAAEQISECRPGPSVRNMRELNAGRGSKKNCSKVNTATRSGRRIAELARLRLGERNQLLHVVRRQRRSHQYDQRTGSDNPNWRAVLARLVAGHGLTRI